MVKILIVSGGLMLSAIPSWGYQVNTTNMDDGMKCAGAVCFDCCMNKTKNLEFVNRTSASSIPSIVQGASDDAKAAK